MVGWWNLWMCLRASIRTQAAEIKPRVHLILRESNYCRITLCFAIRGDNRAALIYTTQSSCSVCCYTFLPGGKWSSSERWLTLFCPCFLILQIGLSQHLICWRLSYICNTVVLVAGNLEYLVYPYELLYRAEQGHFRLCFCLSNQTPSHRHFVQYLWNHFQFTSYLGYMGLTMCPCPLLPASTPLTHYLLSRYRNFILVSEK